MEQGRRVLDEAERLSGIVELRFVRGRNDVHSESWLGSGPEFKEGQKEHVDEGGVTKEGWGRIFLGCRLCNV